MGSSPTGNLFLWPNWKRQLSNHRKDYPVKKFNIDPAYLTDMMVKESYSIFRGKEILTDEDMVIILKGEDIVTSQYNIDHPEFTKLREQLAQEGYIKIERGWWNGDHVTNDFMVNDFPFKEGEKFPCAAALGIHIKVAKQHMK